MELVGSHGGFDEASLVPCLDVGSKSVSCLPGELDKPVGLVLTSGACDSECVSAKNDDR